MLGLISSAAGTQPERKNQSSQQTMPAKSREEAGSRRRVQALTGSNRQNENSFASGQRIHVSEPVRKALTAL